MIKLIFCVSLTIFANFIPNTMHLSSTNTCLYSHIHHALSATQFRHEAWILLSAAYGYASSATQVWCKAQILLSATYLIETNERLVAHPNPWSPPSKLHLSLSKPRVPAPSATSCNTNKKLSEDSQLLSTCYSHHFPPCNWLPTVLAMPTRFKEAEAHKKEEEAMAAATLQREKEAAACRRKEESAVTAARPIDTSVTVTAATSIGRPPIITPLAHPSTSVASPSSAANLNSLLLCWTGRFWRGYQYLDNYGGFRH